jgi:hypothetical protein
MLQIVTISHYGKAARHGKPVRTAIAPVLVKDWNNDTSPPYACRF